MKKLGNTGYQATSEDVDNNTLIGIIWMLLKMLKKFELTNGVYQKVLSYLMFVKCKRTGWKARDALTDVPNWIHIKGKIHLTYPFYLLLILIFSWCAMYAIEERNVVMCDLLGAFLQANLLDDINCHLKFEGDGWHNNMWHYPYIQEECVDQQQDSEEEAKPKSLYGSIWYPTIAGVVIFY